MQATRPIDGSEPVIAIVDDDPQVRETLSALMHDSGFAAVSCADIDAFHALGDPPPVDLALIDLRLRGESGLTLAIHLRERHEIPIVMLTGVGDEIDKIIGLETGADDYLIKPFNPRELVARIRAVLRRYGHASARAVAPGKRQIAFGEKRIDLDARRLLDGTGEEVALTNAEYRLLEFLARNPERVVPREELLEALGADTQRYVDRTVDVLILRLRRKIGRMPAKPVHLQTRRARGYVFHLAAG